MRWGAAQLAGVSVGRRGGAAGRPAARLRAVPLHPGVRTVDCPERVAYLPVMTRTGVSAAQHAPVYPVTD